MSPARSRVPARLPADVVSLAQARRAGLTPGELRHRRLHVPTPGLRVTGEPATLPVLCRALADVLPRGAAFSHVTAARLHGLPLPDRWHPGEPVHVVHPTAQVSRRLVVGHRAVRRTTSVAGLVVTHPLDTWRDLAEGLPLDDLVALGDAVVHLGAGTVDDVATIARRPGRGAAAARPAAALVRAGAESAWETFTRLVVVRAGLPEPQLNPWVLDEDGLAVARVDLLWPEQRVVVEYEGDQHRTDARQWRRDITRTRRLEALGYRVLRVTRHDLEDRRARARFLADLARALGLG